MRVLKNPEKELRVRSEEVEKDQISNEDMQSLIDNMIETMAVENGIGIAAPQVGVHQRVIIVDKDGDIDAYINPKIFSKSLRKVDSEEGCLSVPGVYGIVRRHKKVKVKALNRKGEKVQLSLSGMPAIIFQHEIDHLDGVLFIDRVERYTSPPKL
jgi:peptide deformylase